MKNLRRKLAEAGATVELKSVYGFGYKLSLAAAIRITRSGYVTAPASEYAPPHETHLPHRPAPVARPAASDGALGRIVLLYDGRRDQRRGRRCAGRLFGADRQADARGTRTAEAEQRVEQQLFDRAHLALPKPPSVRISITTTPRSTFPKRRRPSRPANRQRFSRMPTAPITN